MSTMPVFTIKAKDRLAFDAIEHYAYLCRQAGLAEQAAEVDKALAEIHAWRLAHPDLIQDPDHPHVPAEDAEQEEVTAVAIAIGEDGTAYLDDDTEVPAGDWEEASTR